MNRELDQLLKELRDEGWLDSIGTFTLDAAKAREKLAQRQSREAGLWLVKLIQCAHLWEASRLEFRQKRDQARAILQLGPTPQDLRPWLARLHDIEMMADPTFGPLATAFQAALADGCEFVEIATESGRLRLDAVGVHGDSQSLQPSRRLELTFHYLRQQPWWNPLLHLSPPRRSLENFLAASRKAGLALPHVDMDRYPISGSQALLQKSLGEFPNPVRLERVWLSSAPARELMLYPPAAARRAGVEEVQGRVSQLSPLHRSYQPLRQWHHDQAIGLPLPTDGDLQPWLDHLHAQGLHTPPPATQNDSLAMRGLICWSLDSHLPASILPVKYGIVLDAMPFTSLPPGVAIWLSSSRWRTDIHQKKVVNDEVSRQLCNWCLDQFDAMLADAQELMRPADYPLEQLAQLRVGLSRRPHSLAAPKNSPFPG